MKAALKRIFKTGWQGFSRDGGLIFVTIFTLTATLILVSSLFLLRDVSKSLASSLQERVDFSVYFKEDVLEDDIFQAKDEISRIPELAEIDYVSKEEALAEFKRRHEKDAILMEAVEEVGGNPFLASLNIKALEASQYQAIASLLEESDFKNIVEKIDYQERKPVIERLFSITSIMNWGGLVLSIILIIVAVLVTFNTIRLAIYSFREEIKIQRLVGASNWFIRGPFLAQGIIAGVFSGLVSFFIMGIASWLVSSKIDFLFSGLNLFSIFLQNLGWLLLIQFGMGISIGAISAVISMRKYLRV